MIDVRKMAGYVWGSQRESQDIFLEDGGQPKGKA